jgi:hypothetical protein
VFISYASEEYDLAEFVSSILQVRIPYGISVFIAKRDIKPGSDPLKIMLEQQLLHAEVLLAICSQRSKNSPWLWWESSAVWARNGLVIPLFTDINPSDFDGPLTLVRQGRTFFDSTELSLVLQTVVDKLSPRHNYEKQLSEKEINKLISLKNKYKAE